MVALVGAGPGDPDLMTLRAEAALAAATTVVTDGELEGLVRLFAPQADVMVVPNGQPASSAILAAVARAGGVVVRLYVGDPWLHPAHGAELAAMVRAGIASDAVAGVATEVAVPALAGIAVHVRHLAVACTIGPLEAMPTAPDPARTLVIRTEDAGAAAMRLGVAGAHIPAAVVPLARPTALVRGKLADAGHRAPAGPFLLVVGAVAGSAAAPAVAAHSAAGGDGLTSPAQRAERGRGSAGAGFDRTSGGW
jgi:uroporphyrinogen III methyltransferase/synthase